MGGHEATHSTATPVSPQCPPLIPYWPARPGPPGRTCLFQSQKLEGPAKSILAIGPGTFRWFLLTVRQSTGVRQGISSYAASPSRLRSYFT